MKQVVSVSLGSSTRDFSQALNLFKHQFRVTRLGTDASLSKAAKLLQDWDGRADALGLGGINLCYHLGTRHYNLPQASFLARQVKKTPLVDGSQVKALIEPEMVKMTQALTGPLTGKRALLVSALDRYWLGKALEEAGCRLMVADAAFALKLPLVFNSLATFEAVACIAMPFLRLLPIQWLYPLGKKQRQVASSWHKLYLQADIIAGDFHFIRRHLPQELPGKTVITSTVSSADVQLLRQKGVKLLLTTTPCWEGRSMGANVLEAILTAVMGRGKTSADLRRFLAEHGYTPGFTWLN